MRPRPDWPSPSTTRYARRQFAPAPQLPETLLLDYPSHQRRLLPVLAKAYALDATLDWLNSRYAVRTDETMQELESQAAGLKAYATWYTTEALQVCREACGGKGYLLDNRIGQRKGDTRDLHHLRGATTRCSATWWPGAYSRSSSRALMRTGPSDFCASRRGA